MDPYPGSLSSAPRTPASPVFSVPTSEGTHTPGEQRSPLEVGQKAGVTHHLLKMPRWNVAKITPEHLSLAQRLPFMYASPCGGDPGNDGSPRHRRSDAGVKLTSADASVSGRGTSHCTKAPLVFLMADKRPEQALKAVTELTSVAASAPAVAAMAFRPGNANDWQPGWQQAEWLPLQEAWVSLLHRLCENKYLDKDEVISAPPSHKKEHKGDPSPMPLPAQHGILRPKRSLAPCCLMLPAAMKNGSVALET